MSTLSVKLVSILRRPFTGHRVSASFFYELTGGDVTSTLEIPGMVTVLVDAEGFAALELPTKDTLVRERN